MYTASRDRSVSSLSLSLSRTASLPTQQLTSDSNEQICCWFEDVKTGGGFKIARVLLGHSHRINSLSISSAYVNRTGPFYNLIEDEMRGVDPNVKGNLIGGSFYSNCTSSRNNGLTGGSHAEIAKKKYEAARRKVSAFGDEVPFERLVGS